jgi:hypothetical protein
MSSSFTFSLPELNHSVRDTFFEGKVTRGISLWLARMGQGCGLLVVASIVLILAALNI